MKIKPSIAALAFLCFSSFLPAQSNGKLASLLSAVNDHQRARQSLQSAVITAAPARALEFAPRAVQGPKGKSYVFIEKNDNLFSIVFSSSQADEPRKAGDFIIRRSVNPNLVKYLKILLNDGGSDYVMLEPYQTNDRTSLKVVTGDKTLYSKILIAAPLYTLYTQSAANILALAASRIDWESVLSTPAAAAPDAVSSSSEPIEKAVEAPVPNASPANR
jgi:hypothetical protein